MPTRIIKLFRR